MLLGVDAGVDVPDVPDGLDFADGGPLEVVVPAGDGTVLVVPSSPRVKAYTATSAAATSTTPRRTQKPRSGVGSPLPGTV